MDPNANLAEQDQILAADRPLSAAARRRLSELRLALSSWLARKGFEPTWTQYPIAAAHFQTWRRSFRK